MIQILFIYNIIIISQSQSHRYRNLFFNCMIDSDAQQFLPLRDPIVEWFLPKSEMLMLILMYIISRPRPSVNCTNHILVSLEALCYLSLSHSCRPPLQPTASPSSLSTCQSGTHFCHLHPLFFPPSLHRRTCLTWCLNSGYTGLWPNLHLNEYL